MRKIEVPLEYLHSRAALHQYLQESLALPSYYGANLDALYDCLTEIAEETELIMPLQVAQADYLGGYGEVLLQLLQDAAQGNPQLQVVLRSAE